MPPKKRKVTGPPENNAKKARTTKDRTLNEDNTEATVSERPKRNSVGEPKHNFTGTKVSFTTKIATFKSRPGGPSKTIIEPDSELKVVTRRPRGRPKDETALARKSTGRPRKFVEKVSNDSAITRQALKGPDNANVAKVRSKVRPPKAQITVTSHAAKPRGRQHSHSKAVTTDSSGKANAIESVKDSDWNGRDVQDHVQDVQKHIAQRAEEKDEGENHPGEHQYWLMKAEPESRIEKGHDVKFSIDDLRAAKTPEPWDGVRNPVARNNMRAMRQGDLAFFYHSNCKMPGIVGILKVVQEHTVDESAFDPNHPYFDPKSDRKKPRWELVHVEFVHKFKQVLTLQELKTYAAQPGNPLANLQTLKQTRLSVSAVQPAEWRYILELMQEQIAGINDMQEVQTNNDNEQG